MNTTTDTGSQARTRPHDEAPVQRLAELRATLLGGRGRGASNEEVTEHTRDRPWLGAVPAPVERALVARRGEHQQGAAPIVNRRMLHRERSRSLGTAVLGAVVALVVRAVTVRRAQSRHQRRASKPQPQTQRGRP